MRRAIALVAGAVLIVVALANPAAAIWSTGSDVHSAGRAVAMTMPAGASPVAVASGSDVTVAWARTTSPPASGYSVRVFDALSGVERSIDAGCAGVIAASTCTEHGVPRGSWRYAVIPQLENWMGLESTRSGPASVDTADPQPSGLTLEHIAEGCNMFSAKLDGCIEPLIPNAG